MINTVFEKLPFPKPVSIILLILILLGVIALIAWRKTVRKNKMALAEAYTRKMREEELDELIRNDAKEEKTQPNRPYETSYETKEETKVTSGEAPHSIKTHIIVQTPTATRKYLINIADELLIGKDPTSGIVLDTGQVSPAHCGLINHNGNLFVRDYGSVNGTTLLRKSKKAMIDEQQVQVMNGDELLVAGNRISINFL